MSKEQKAGSNPYFNTRQYLTELFGAMAIYLVVIILTMGRIGDTEPGLMKMALALAPVVPLILVFWVIMRQYNRSDELHKRMAREAFVLGAMMFGWIVIIWGFAELGGAPPIPTLVFGPTLLGLWGLATPIVMRKYR